MVKNNFDGAQFQHHGSVGVGDVVRDCEGKFRADHSLCVAGLFIADIVELMAAVEALNLALRLGFRRVCLEGNAA